MVDTGNGAKGAEKKGNQDMAENSETSAKQEKTRTRRTAKLTREEALEILQASLLEYQKAGGQVEIVPEFYFDGRRFVAVLLPDTQFNGTDIVPLMAQAKVD